MPTYQYACTVPSCGHRFEAVQTFTEPALTSCPICDGSLRKVFSAVGVVFKGSGFYRNDSRSTAGAKKSGESSSDKKFDKSDSSGSKTEAKSSSTDSAKSAGSNGSSSSSGSTSTKSSASTSKAASS